MLRAHHLLSSSQLCGVGSTIIPVHSWEDMEHTFHVNGSRETGNCDSQTKSLCAASLCEFPHRDGPAVPAEHGGSERLAFTSSIDGTFWDQNYPVLSRVVRVKGTGLRPWDSTKLTATLQDQPGSGFLGKSMPQPTSDVNCALKLQVFIGPFHSFLSLNMNGVPF